MLLTTTLILRPVSFALWVLLAVENKIKDHDYWLSDLKIESFKKCQKNIWNRTYNECNNFITRLVRPILQVFEVEYNGTLNAVSRNLTWIMNGLTFWSECCRLPWEDAACVSLGGLLNQVQRLKKANCIFRASSLFAKTDDTIFKRLVVVESSRLTALHAEIEKKGERQEKVIRWGECLFKNPDICFGGLLDWQRSAAKQWETRQRARLTETVTDCRH